MADLDIETDALTSVEVVTVPCLFLVFGCGNIFINFPIGIVGGEFEPKRLRLG